MSISGLTVRQQVTEWTENSSSMNTQHRKWSHYMDTLKLNFTFSIYAATHLPPHVSKWEKKYPEQSIVVGSSLLILSCLSTAVILIHEIMDRRPSRIILHSSAILPLFHAHINLTHSQPMCQRPQPPLFTERSLPKSFLLLLSLRDLHHAELTGDP